jgi:glucokinase
VSSPVVLIVTGPPCSGKSTLASQIGARFGLPLLEKDAIKEALFDSVGIGDRDWSRRLSQASFEMLLRLAAQVVSGAHSIVIEGNFAEPQAPALESLRVDQGAVLVQIRCGGSSAVLLERMQARAERPLRHPGHLDAALLEEARAAPPPEWSEPLPIVSIELQFDSTVADAAALEQLLARIEAVLGPQPLQRVSTSSTSD